MDDVVGELDIVEAADTSGLMNLHFLYIKGFCTWAYNFRLLSLTFRINAFGNVYPSEIYLTAIKDPS